MLCYPLPRRVAKIVFPDRKSCCIRRQFGVKKHHANFQVAAHGLRGCLSCEFHSRPRGRHSGSSRRPRGVGSKDGGNGLAFKPAGAGGDCTGRTGGNKLRQQPQQHPSTNAAPATNTPVPTPAPPVASEPQSSPAAATTPAPATPPPADNIAPADTGAHRNPTGSHTDNVRNKCCSSGCSRAHQLSRSQHQRRLHQSRRHRLFQPPRPRRAQFLQVPRRPPRQKSNPA